VKRMCVLSCAVALALVAQPRQDPAVWGIDHVGKPVPEFTHGDECLFCHRNDVGPAWQKNAHGLALRQREDAPDLAAKIQAEAPDATHVLGSRNHIRYLKQAGYGKFDIGSSGKWESGKFETRCVGCHATGVNSTTRAYTAIGLDCYTCHGVVDLEHTGDTSKIFLSKKRRTDVLAITSTCAQCHLRGGKSRSTGLPYPNTFVAGDNLLKDYEADFAKADDPAMNPGDRHVWKNVRDVVTNGSQTTCLGCHRVHAGSTEKHRRVLTSAICSECHNPGGPKKVVTKYEVHSPVCEY
jgi:predicted CXXCH cytochrome family protein